MLGGFNRREQNVVLDEYACDTSDASFYNDPHDEVLEFSGCSGDRPVGATPSTASFSHERSSPAGASKQLVTRRPPSCQPSSPRTSRDSERQPDGPPVVSKMSMQSAASQTAVARMTSTTSRRSLSYGFLVGPTWDSETKRSQPPSTMGLPIPKRGARNPLNFLSFISNSSGVGDAVHTRHSEVTVTDHIKVDALPVDRIGTQFSTATDRNVRNMGRFFELNRTEACAWVRQGEYLTKHPSEWQRADVGRYSVLRELRRKPYEMMRRSKRYFFRVMDRHQTPSGHPELRWHFNERLMEGDPRPKGRLILSEVHYVTATVLQDSDIERLPASASRLHSEFRVVCPGYTLKLVAPNRDSMKFWVVGLLHLSRLAKRRNDKFKRTTVDAALWRAICQEFRRIDQDNSGHISREELEQVLPEGISPEEVFAEFDQDEDGVLELQEFAEFFQTFAVKSVLSPLFMQYASRIPEENGDQALGISPAKWVEFQREIQCENDESDDLKGPFDKLQSPHVLWREEKPYLTEAGFSHLLCNPRNSAVDPTKRSRVYQDMTKPLSHYWIASSHNTYLMRDQMFGLSRLEQYIEVLLRGCRCVEIDCWDGDCGEPMVTHGYTATTRLVFADVVRVCRDYGFVASQYPLILSLEVHCSPRQLTRMGTILKDVLGDQLMRLPEGGLALAELTTPEAAMNKVLVKGKVPLELQAENLEKSERGPEGARDDASLIDPDMTPHRRSWACCLGGRRRRARSEPSDLRDSDEDLERMSSEAAALSERRSDSPKDSQKDEIESPVNARHTGGTDTLVVPNTSATSASPRAEKQQSVQTSGSSRARALLSAMPWRSKETWKNVDYGPLQEYARTLYLVSTKLHRLEGPLALEPCNIVSLNEKKASKLMKIQGEKNIQDHHRLRLSRVYPSASRTDSSNYNPMPFWLAGFQFVALNYQSMDVPTIVNEGLFRNENGGSGYVLKPEPSILKHDSGGELPCTLELTVLCAQYLPKPAAMLLGGVTNPHVRVSVCGCNEDSQHYQTRQIQDNGFNPRWDETTFFELTQPHVAVICFEVFHSSVVCQNRGGSLRRTNSLFSADGGGGDEAVESPAHVPFRRSGTVNTVNTVDTTARPRNSTSRTSRLAGIAAAKGSSQERLAAAAIPLSGLREGIRWVQLLDWSHHPMDKCGLLVHVQLRGPWADQRKASSASTVASPAPEDDTVVSQNAHAAKLLAVGEDDAAVSQKAQAAKLLAIGEEHQAFHERLLTVMEAAYESSRSDSVQGKKEADAAERSTPRQSSVRRSASGGLACASGGTASRVISELSSTTIIRCQPSIVSL